MTNNDGWGHGVIQLFVLKFTVLYEHTVCMTLLDLNEHLSVFAGHTNPVKRDVLKHSYYYGKINVSLKDRLKKRFPLMPP